MPPSEPDDSFRSFLGSWIRDGARDLTRRWVEILTQRLPDTEPDRILPSDDLLNHIPRLVEGMGEHVADPRTDVPEALVVQDLHRLIELRRRQGFGIQELLREYEILSDLIQEEAEEAADAFHGPVEAREVVAATGDLRDAVHLLSSVTAHSFRVFALRYEQEKSDLLASYGEMLSHELGNRLGAAETAVRLLRSDVSLPPERRDRLEVLILEGIQRALETVQDVRVLADPEALRQGDRRISLRLLVKEAVRQAKVRASREGIDLLLHGDVPDVRAPGAAVRLVLSNLMGNAIKYHRPRGEDRWVRVTAKEIHDAIEVAVEDNGPGIAPEERERIFDQHYRGDVEGEGSGLGLAIASDALRRFDGRIEVEEGEEGGARFTFRLPLDVVERPGS